MLKLLLPQRPKHNMESKSPTVPLGQVCNFRQAAFLEKPGMFLTDLGSLELSYNAEGLKRHVHVVVPLSVSVGPLAHPQAQGKPALKDLQKAFFPQSWKWSSQDVGNTSLHQGRSGRQPVSVCKPVFARNWLGVPAGELHFCSEAPNSRVRAQHLP